MDVIIVGAGIGGLTLALMLEKVGIPFRLYESAREIRPIGVGISILPHASRELNALGLQDALADVAVTARESCFFNRFGQLVYKEPVGTSPATTIRSSRSTGATCSRSSTARWSSAPARTASSPAGNAWPSSRATAKPLPVRRQPHR
ncbi:tryptophan 7-halogenase [Mesorhizobium sp. CC13]|uniref:tryptophan 7-halogenase n=1 Tax=Mesorhizobium sp. CC13 TaxID=3029194 RepID=UPI003264B1D7